MYVSTQGNCPFKNLSIFRDFTTSILFFLQRRLKQWVAAKSIFTPIFCNFLSTMCVAGCHQAYQSIEVSEVFCEVDSCVFSFVYPELFKHTPLLEQCSHKMLHPFPNVELIPIQWHHVLRFRWNKLDFLDNIFLNWHHLLSWCKTKQMKTADVLKSNDLFLYPPLLHDLVMILFHFSVFFPLIKCHRIDLWSFSTIDYPMAHLSHFCKCICNLLKDKSALSVWCTLSIFCLNDISVHLRGNAFLFPAQGMPDNRILLPCVWYALAYFPLINRN